MTPSNMPKDGRDRFMPLKRSPLSPFSQSLPGDSPEENDSNTNQWEDARCPVCMEHPHNAILLTCSSHSNGCRPFICDTSYRHSNCFDQLRKSFSGADPEPFDEPKQFVCPLCRGPVSGWVVVEPARKFMNDKVRSCASETCDYSGSYNELRRHARLVHPLARPADVDVERQHSWRRLEREREMGDLLSTLRVSMENEIDEGGWLTMFFLVRFIGLPRGSDGPRGGDTMQALRRLWYDGEDEDEGPTGPGPSRYVRRRSNPDANE
ncbi:hypothetical protein STAS_00982 [Striga asiatica]|uniref:Uncharacterized protein n=1 Tax=Striga asiatica TaxID=4170 RepID=A0A5A7NY07_STRAF|nr:hypothetical protein STAS_00982 [Striga asiatica]